jgi:hypothetical protein
MEYQLFLYFFILFILFTPRILFHHKQYLDVIYPFCFILTVYFTYDFIRHEKEPMDNYSLKVDNSTGLFYFLDLFRANKKPVEIDITNTKTQQHITEIKGEKTVLKPPKSTLDKFYGSGDDIIIDGNRLMYPAPGPDPIVKIVPEYCAYDYGTKGKNITLVCPEELPVCNGYKYDEINWGKCGPKVNV